jgi:integration host factor subunit beta
MIRSELIARIAEQNLHLYAKDVAAVVDTILDMMADALARGDRVELRDFGVFATKKRPERTGCNPKTRAPVTIAARRNILFKPGKALQARLNLDQSTSE